MRFRIIGAGMVVGAFALADIAPAQPVPGPNVNIFASDRLNQKQLEVEAAANPLAPHHIFAGVIHYVTVVENPNRVTSKGVCGWSFSTNGGKTWKNGVLPAVPNMDKCGDPAIAWDTNGHAFYFALVELTTGTTLMKTWRFTDPNDGTGALILDNPQQGVEVDRGSPGGGGQTLDKGALFFQPDPASTNPSAPGTLAACYTNFTGQQGNLKVVCRLSRDGGRTFFGSKAKGGILNGTVKSNNGTAIAPASNGDFFVFWRAFSASENGYYFVRVNGRNGDPTDPVRVPLGGPLYAYDGITRPDLARSLAFPTAASDGGSKILLTFQAYVNTAGIIAPPAASGSSPRIVGVYSNSGGKSWTAPFVIDYGPHDDTHQFMPRATYAGGLWSVLFYDARNDLCFEQEPQDPTRCGRPLNPVMLGSTTNYFPTGRDRRFDVRVAQSLDPTNFGASTQVTLYDTRNGEIVQRDPKCAPDCPAVNFPFLSVGAGGTAAWMGDYIAHLPKVLFLRNINPSAPAWRYTRLGDDVTTLAFWADFRRVGFPVNQSGALDINGNWTIFFPAGDPACTNPTSRDVDVRFSEILTGGITGTVRSTAQRPGIPAEFAVQVQNLSGRDLFLRLEIVDGASTAPTEDWSMAQTPPPPSAPPDDDNFFDLLVRHNASVTKAIYYRSRSSTPTAGVEVRIHEMTGVDVVRDGGRVVEGTPGGTRIVPPDGLYTTVNYAPSFTSGAGTAHDITVGDPVVDLGAFTGNSFSRKGQPSNASIENELAKNGLDNNGLDNNGLDNNGLDNNGLDNSLIEDKQVVWTVTGAGALTTAISSITNVANGQELLEAGWEFQLIFYLKQVNPRVLQCKQLLLPTDVILSQVAITKANGLDNNGLDNHQVSNNGLDNNGLDNNALENSQISDQITNATFPVDSGEEVHVALRAFKPASSALTLQIVQSTESEPIFDPGDPRNIGQAAFSQAEDPATGATIADFFDASAPEVMFTADGTLGELGNTEPPTESDWYVTPVTVSWFVKDAQSGIVSQQLTRDGQTVSTTDCPDVTLSDDTTGTTLECTAVNGEGLSTTTAVTIKIDQTPPTVDAAIAPPSPADSGWYNTTTGPPTVSFTCFDAQPGSGVECRGPVVVGDGANQTVSSGLVEDFAGNDADGEAQITGIDVDTTPPGIAAAISHAPAATGWYNITTGQPTVSFTCPPDATSGLVGPCPSPVLVGDGANQTIARSISDNAGNTSEASMIGINVDTIRPDTVIDSGPTGTIDMASATFTFHGTDAITGSGVASFECELDGEGYSPCTSPEELTGLSEGSHTFRVRAIDAAGNVDDTPASRTFSVNTDSEPIDGALSFDGVNDFVVVPHSLALNSPQALEAWVKIDSSTFDIAPVITKGSDYGSYHLGILGSETLAVPGDVQYVLRTPTGNFSCAGGGESFTFGEWNHIAATFSGGTVKIFVNGAPVQTCTGAPGPIPNEEPLFFGRATFGGGPDRWLNGSLDEIRIWRTLRTDSDIAASYYNALTPADAPNLKGYWPFDESTGQVVVDSSAEGLDGTRGPSTAVESEDPTRISGGVVPVTVAVDAQPFGVAAHSGTGYAYVANWQDSTVSVVDIDRTRPTYGSVVTTITSNISGPLGVAVNTATNRVYVTNEADGGSVAVIDGDPDSPTSNTVITSISVGGGASEGVSVDTTTGRTWLGNYTANSHTAIAGLTSEGTRAPGCGVRGVAVNPVTHRVYMANSWCGGLLVVDGDPTSAAYRESSTSVGGFSFPRGVSVNPAENHIYVTDTNSSTLSVVSGGTNMLLWSIPVNGGASGVAYSAATKLAYVATLAGTLIAVDADPASGTYQTIIRTLSFGAGGGTSTHDGGPVSSVSVDPDRAVVVVTNPTDGTITVFGDARP